MSLQTARHLLWAAAVGLLSGAAWSLHAVQPVAFVATAGLFIIAIPVDMALHNEIRYRAGSPSAKIAGRRPWWWRLWRRITSPVAIAALPLALIPIGMLTATPASADPEVDGYIAASAHTICTQLDHNPTYQGVTDLGWFLMAVSGFTAQQAAEVVYRSVADQCPAHLPLILEFADDAAPVTAPDVRMVVLR